MEAASKDPTAASHGDYFDIVIVHQYGNPLNIYVATRMLQRALAMYGLDRPIWIGESNIVPDDDPMNPLNSALHGSMNDQAAYVIQGFALARAAGVERMSIYKLVDEAKEGAGELYGLVRNDGSVRPAFQSFQTAVWYERAYQRGTGVGGRERSAHRRPASRLIQQCQSHAMDLALAAINCDHGARPGARDRAWNASPKLV
jgi:hypothetical protein